MPTLGEVATVDEQVYIPEAFLGDRRDVDLLRMYAQLEVDFDVYWAGETARIAADPYSGPVMFTKQELFETELRFIKSQKERVDTIFEQEPLNKVIATYDLDHSILRIPYAAVGDPDKHPADHAVIRPGFAIVNNGLREIYGDQYSYGLMTSWPQANIGRIFKRLYGLSPAMNEDMLISTRDGVLVKTIAKVQDFLLQQRYLAVGRVVTMSMDTFTALRDLERSEAVAQTFLSSLSPDEQIIYKAMLRMSHTGGQLLTTEAEGMIADMGNTQDIKVLLAVLLTQLPGHGADTIMLFDDWTDIGNVQSDHSQVRMHPLRDLERDIDLQFRLLDDPRM